MDTRESGHHSGVSGREGAAASYRKGLFQFAHGFFSGWSLKVVQGGGEKGFTDCETCSPPEQRWLGQGGCLRNNVMFGLQSNGNSRYGWKELALRQFFVHRDFAHQGPTPIGARWCNSSTVGGRNCDKGLKAGRGVVVEAMASHRSKVLGGWGPMGI